MYVIESLHCTPETHNILNKAHFNIKKIITQWGTGTSSDFGCDILRRTQYHYSATDAGSIPGSGRSPGGGNGNPLQYYCLKNPMDRGACKVTGQRARHNWANKHINVKARGSKVN